MNKTSDKTYSDIARAVITQYGGAQALFNDLQRNAKTDRGLSRGSIQKWKQNGIAPAWVIEVAQLTGTSVTVLRPDYYPRWLFKAHGKAGSKRPPAKVKQKK